MNPQVRIALTLSAALLACLLCSVVSGVACTLFQEILYPASLAAPITTKARPYSSTLEAGYYRGVYDTCFFLYTVSGGSIRDAERDCRKLKERAIERNWYVDGPSWAGAQ